MQDLVNIPVVEIDRRRATTDLARDLPRRDAVDPVREAEPPRGVEDRALEVVAAAPVGR
jgi:hypothetical protein